MRPRIGLAAVLATAAFAFAAFAPALARATDCSGLLSPCVNDDALWPHAGPAHFVAVGSTETVDAGQLGFALITSYISRPIVIKLRSPGDSSDQFAINDQVNGTFLWSYGVTRRLELDLAVPLTFGQGGTGLAPVTGGAGLNDTAVRDLRFGLTYVLVPHPSMDRARERRDPASTDASMDTWGLAARFEVSAPTGDRDQFAGEPSAVFAPSLAADYRQGRFFGGAEIGARIRPTTELLGARVGTQLVTALGVGVDLLDRELLSATLEAWALPTFAGQDDIVFQNGAYANQSNGKTLVPAEWQLSLRTAPLPHNGLSIQLGGGGRLPLGGEGDFTPRYRFTLGLRWGS